MRFLLDTHALLWYTLNAPELSATAKALIIEKSNEIYVSAISFWEIAIKVSIGKLKLNQPFERFVDTCLHQYQFVTLPIAPQHTTLLVGMPFHHRDPFDRMLIAQSIAETIPIISSDVILDAYGVQRSW